MDFFRRLPKTKVDSAIGTTLTPNFYYRIATARLVMLARSSAILARLPQELAPLEIAPGLANDHLHSYVLALPVSTQIAQVRGHDGYGFPKWVTGLDVDIDARRTTARVANEAGGTDLALAAATPTQTRHATGQQVSSLTSYTTIDGAWHATLSQTNLLSAGRARFPRHVDLRIGQGRMADDLRSLQPIRAVQLDVVTEAQLALHMPVPTSVPSQR